MSEFRPVITRSLLHKRMVEIFDGADTTLPEVRNLARLNIPQSPDESRKLDAIEGQLLLKNARVGITSTELLMASLRKKSEVSPPKPAPSPAIKLSDEDVRMILAGQKPASVPQIDYALKHAQEFGLSLIDVEALKQFVRDRYASVVRKHGGQFLQRWNELEQQRLQSVATSEQNDSTFPEWIGKRRPKKKE